MNASAALQISSDANDSIADFDLAAFEHRAVWNGLEHRIEMHLRSAKAQKVCIE